MRPRLDHVIDLMIAVVSGVLIGICVVMAGMWQW